MAQFLAVPPTRLPADTLQSLLEEYASRDGTDYGEREFSLDEKVRALQSQLDAKEIQILFDMDAETWDIVPRDRAEELLNS